MRHEASLDRPAAWSRAALDDAGELCRAQQCAIAYDEPLARHTSLGVGGPAPLMVWPAHPEALVEVASWMSERALPWRVLGAGTNVLAPDQGIGEAVICLTRLCEGTEVRPGRVTFPAGLPTAQALKMTLRHGLAGLVWATGLPGTIGGAVAGNAGCWGGEMSATVRALDIVDARGNWTRRAAHQLDWSYRHLDLQKAAGAGCLVAAATMELEPGDPAALAARCEELQKVRRQRQPVGARNAGCIFKNPDADHPAGKLVDDAGCKGMRIGDAEVSTLHGNFFINHGAATAAHVEQLIAAVKEAVRSRFGIVLSEEIRRW